MKLRKGQLIVGGLILLGLSFLAIGVLMTDKEPSYYAHSLRNWQEADAVPGYPIPVNGDVKPEFQEFVTMQFAPNLTLLSGIDLHLLPIADGFVNPLGDFAIVEENYGNDGLLGAKLNSGGGGILGVGDPVFAAGTGLVLFRGKAEGHPGEVLVLGHRTPAGSIVQSLYSRLSETSVALGKVIPRGEKLAVLAAIDGEVGLHFEIREAIGLDVARQNVSGVTLNELRSPHRFNRIDPIAFLQKNAPQSPWPDPLVAIRSSQKKSFSEALEMDAESAAKLSEILGGEE